MYVSTLVDTLLSHPNSGLNPTNLLTAHDTCLKIALRDRVLYDTWVTEIVNDHLAASEN